MCWWDIGEGVRQVTARVTLEDELPTVGITNTFVEGWCWAEYLDMGGQFTPQDSMKCAGSLDG